MCFHPRSSKRVWFTLWRTSVLPWHQRVRHKVSGNTGRGERLGPWMEGIIHKCNWELYYLHWAAKVEKCHWQYGRGRIWVKSTTSSHFPHLAIWSKVVGGAAVPAVKSKPMVLWQFGPLHYTAAENRGKAPKMLPKQYVPQSTKKWSNMRIPNWWRVQLTIAVERVSPSPTSSHIAITAINIDRHLFPFLATLVALHFTLVSK